MIPIREDVVGNKAMPHSRSISPNRHAPGIGMVLVIVTLLSVTFQNQLWRVHGAALTYLIVSCLV